MHSVGTSTFSSNSIACLAREERYQEADKLLDELEHASTQDLQDGLLDNQVSSIVDTCVKLQDREGLRRLAYVLFSGARYKFYDYNLTILSYLFIDDELDNDILGKALLSVFNHWKKEYKPDDLEEESETKATLQPWNGYNEELGPNDQVLFIHGGGARHFASFLKQEATACYQCDGYGTGIFVTPFKGKVENVAEINFSRLALACPRAIEYANRTPLQQFDHPIVAAGTIKSKHLIRTRNIYEAVISELKKNKAKNVHVFSVKINPSQLPLVRPESMVPKYFPDNVELQQEIIGSLNKTIEAIKRASRYSWS